MIQWLADQCTKYFLDEKWLVAEDLRTAQQWKDRLNLTGHSSINLHSKTIRTLAVSVAGNVLADRELTFASEATTRMMVRGLVGELLEAGKLQYFGHVQTVDGLADLMTKSIRDLRLAELNPQSVKAKAFESAAKARDVKRVFDAYCDRLDSERTADYASCVHLATSGIEIGSIRLPSDLLVLVPEELELTIAEQRLLDAIKNQAAICQPAQLESFSDEAARHRIRDRLASDDAQFDYFSGQGEVNEVRGVLQRVLSQKRGGPYSFDDVEILHTDYQQYVPLFLELLSTWLARSVSNEDSISEDKLPTVDSLPITFVEGIACVYSRPGRALRAWLRWARYDFVQSRAVQLLREGLLARPSSSGEISYARLAKSLRRIPIGFKAERYVPKIAAAIKGAQTRLTEYQERRDCDSPESQNDGQREFGLPALKAVHAIVAPLVRLAPRSDDKAIIPT